MKFVYLDTSVVLAQLFAEDKKPSIDFWNQPLISSRLLEYETWNRIHARKLEASHGELFKQLLLKIAILELNPEVLARALQPFPAVVRTLDALHLASLNYLMDKKIGVSLATYDEKMASTAKKLGVEQSAV